MKTDHKLEIQHGGIYRSVLKKEREEENDVIMSQSQKYKRNNKKGNI